MRKENCKENLRKHKDASYQLAQMNPSHPTFHNRDDKLRVGVYREVTPEEPPYGTPLVQFYLKHIATFILLALIIGMAYVLVIKIFQ